MEKKVLVVTATLGNRKSLDKTIKSVKDIGKNFVKHVIVCPNNVIPYLRNKYGNSIDYIAEPEDKKGIYPALNKGFYTFGHDYEYMTFINDDDYWLPNFKILIDTILSDNSLDLVYARTKYVDEYNNYIASQTSYPWFNRYASFNKVGINILTQQATIIKSKWFFEQNGFEERFKLVSDAVFWIKLSQKKINYKYINEVVAGYTVQKGQLSSLPIGNEERVSYLKDFSYIKEASVFEILLYRLINLPVYVKRLILAKSINNPLGIYK